VTSTSQAKYAARSFPPTQRSPKKKIVTSKGKKNFSKQHHTGGHEQAPSHSILPAKARAKLHSRK